MKAKHVMTHPVITATPDLTVRQVAQLLTEHRISALPVVDKAGKVIGLVSEGDLIRRFEIGTQRRRSWWLSLFTSNIQLAEEYAHAHATKIHDVMTYDVISVDPEAPLPEIARIFERNHIKRVPVLDNDKLVGIVTRANLVKAIATAPEKEHRPLRDEELHNKILERLEQLAWANLTTISVTVDEGTVTLRGLVNSEAERNAVRIAAEAVHGVKAVKNNLALEPVPAWL
jgi:CBS domain-containing protein